MTEPMRPTPGQMCSQLNTLLLMFSCCLTDEESDGDAAFAEWNFLARLPRFKYLGSQEPTFISVLFVFPDPLALLCTEVVSYSQCLMWWLSADSE